MPKTMSSASSISRKSVNRRAIFVLALFLLTATIAYPAPANWAIARVNSLVGVSIPTIRAPFILGLDLQGGTRLEYVADLSKIQTVEQAAAMEGVRDVIERRVNTIGVSEPLVQVARAGEEYRVSVELAGIRDVNQAINLIGETPILEFKEVNTEPQRQMTDEERKKLEQENAAAKSSAEKTLDAAKKDLASFAGEDLGFIKDKLEYGEIFEQVKQTPAGALFPTVIDTERQFAVVKVEEVKDAGKEIKAYHLLISYGGSAGSESLITKEEARRKIDDLRKQATPANFIALAKQHSTEPGAKETGGDLGWFGPGVMVPEFEAPAFALAKGQISDVIETPFGFHIIYKEDERPLKDVRVRASLYKKTLETDIVPPAEEWKNTALTGKNLKRAELMFDQYSGSAQVSLVFDDEGSKLFADITKRNVGKPVAIFLDGQPISIPTVNTEITGGQAVITGSYSVQEAKLLAQRLNAGALPVPISLVAQQSVGPTLGQDSINASLKAGILGFVLVTIFMLLIYRLPGLVAIAALALYVALTASIFKMVPVTMTLSGIAGFILSIGMAVDTNVLVYERLREELNDMKRPLGVALEESFRRAWSSIWDSHVTILISSAVLYWFSSSIIRGFAVTLAIGTLVSLFTAYMATRTMLRVVARTRLGQMDWLMLKNK